MNSYSNTTFKILSLAVFLSSMAADVFAAKNQVEVISSKAPVAITVDGSMEDAWKGAAEAKMELDKILYKPNNGYAGLTATTVSIRSVYDADSVYFLLQWKDPTESVHRSPWVKQADGSWKLLKNEDSTGHENTNYEDKLAMLWNINAEGFSNMGCNTSCHMADNGMVNGIEDKSPGRKYMKEGQSLDVWHWKSVRTNPVGKMDDQYIDDTNDPTKNAEWGRKSNPNTGGGYVNNLSADKKSPAFMNDPAKKADPRFILDTDKVEFTDNFKAGDEIPSLLLAPFQGPRGNNSAKGVWKEGIWTLEIKRTLVTSGEKAKVQDVQFDDMKKEYFFGVSVFDNAQINHLYHKSSSLKLTFK